MRTLNFIPLVITVILSGLFLIGCGGSGNPPNGEKPPFDEYKDLTVLYGDPHVHTNLSDGDESPDFAIRFARDSVDLDFVCITDHVEYIATGTPALIEYYRSLPERYDDPGQFCVLFGYEWSKIAYGHRNVYSLNSDIPLLSCEDPGYDTIEELWSGLEGFDVITIPHHTIMHSFHSWTTSKNPGVEVAVEFYSKWGNSLSQTELRPLPSPHPPNSVYTGIVTEGLRYGLLAGTDTHMSRPGSVMEESRQEGALDYAQPGLTGVWSTAFTGEGIYNGIKSRHTYGMTGTRLLMMFSVNNSIMGTEISSASAPTITYRVVSPVTIDKIIILKIADGELNNLVAYSPNALEMDGSFKDMQFVDDSAYLLRVELVNTDMALSTPVWVEYTGN